MDRIVIQRVVGLRARIHPQIVEIPQMTSKSLFPDRDNISQNSCFRIPLPRQHHRRLRPAQPRADKSDSAPIH